MSRCPFASILSGSVKKLATATDKDLRHSHSGVSSALHPDIHQAPQPVSRAISTPDLITESCPSVSDPTSSASSSRNTAPKTASGAAYTGPQASSSTPSPAASVTSATMSPRLTRRQLRKLGRTWTLAEVRQHSAKDDAWIAVDGKVYDITEHLVNHPGWEDTSAISTVLSILAHAGTDCSKEFRDIHRPYPVAWRQLAAYYIGDLGTEPKEEALVDQASR